MCEVPDIIQYQIQHMKLHHFSYIAVLKLQHILRVWEYEIRTNKVVVFSQAPADSSYEARMQSFMQFLPDSQPQYSAMECLNPTGQFIHVETFYLGSIIENSQVTQVKI